MVAQSLIGGVMIGLAAVLFLWSNGRILGISGIVLHTKPAPGDYLWRVLFALGLLAGGFVAGQVLADDRVHFTIDTPLWILGLGGLCVGIGTKLGSGCTSGHGVCGMARLSKRSIAATITFILVGMLTTYLLRHVWGGAV